MGDDFKILENLIRRVTLRHGVILSNIANSDTPNYKAKDIRFEDTLGNVSLEFRVTHPRHIKGRASHVSSEVKIETDPPWLDGNNVEPDIEMAKMVENTLLFQAGISMLSTKIRMFKNALRRQL